MEKIDTDYQQQKKTFAKFFILGSLRNQDDDAEDNVA